MLATAAAVELEAGIEPELELELPDAPMSPKPKLAALALAVGEACTEPLGLAVSAVLQVLSCGEASSCFGFSTAQGLLESAFSLPVTQSTRPPRASMVCWYGALLGSVSYWYCVVAADSVNSGH